jgi:hypothetical protein
MDALKSGNAGTTDPVELHRLNIKRTRTCDVMIAAYPSSGSMLISNILTELGFPHVDPYSEVLDADGTATVIPDMVPYRSRYAATAAADAAGHAGGSGLRFVKNHQPSRHIAGLSVGGAVLLVRDPRDAIYSSYRYFHNFARFWWPDGDKAQGTFGEYLDGLGVNDEPPIQGWVDFYRAWYATLPTLPRHAIVRFEDLKADPVAVVADLLRSLDVPRPEASINRAVERSSFEYMRAHEKQIVAGQAVDGASVADRSLVMQRGKVNEWREWFDDSPLAARFLGPELVEVARLFGYRLGQEGDDRDGR